MLEYFKKYLRRKRDMKVNREKVINIVEKMWKTGCPMCHGNTWGFSEDKIVTPIQLNEDRSYKFNGKVLPLVVLTCEKCGNTVFVNALKIGALEDEDTPREGKDNGIQK